MQGYWSFSKESRDSPNELDLKKTPSCVRPETHWVQKEGREGRSDGRLWFSLQLSRDRARELCNAFAERAETGNFANLIKGGALMAPASYAALRFAIAEADVDPADSHESTLDPMDRMLGTDILIPPEAHDALQRLAAPGSLEIADAGLALDTGEPLPIKLGPDIPTWSPVLKGPVPDYSPVIIAVIDDGIGIANHRFRVAPTKTRVEHFLDLSLIGTPTAGGAVDELLGWSWTAAAIDDVLGQYPNDEERVYRALGLIDPKAAQRQPLRAAVSHGTHVLDTAAGYDCQNKAEAKKAAKRPIIAVQLPTPAAEHRSDTWLPLSLKRALDWILVKADELSVKAGDGTRLPLIVNCSFGSMAGPMDGWSDVERRITQFVRAYRAGGEPELCTVVLPAGNSRLLRAAARVPIDKQGVSVPWRVLPDDGTPSFVQVWLPPLPKNVPQQVGVALRPPGQKSPEEFSVLDKALDWTIGNGVRARLYHQSVSRPADRRRECITIAIRATADGDAPTPVVPAGLWHIDIKPTKELEGPLKADLHVHRDDVGMFARGKGRQSYFDDPNYRQVEMAGKRPAADGDPPAFGSALVREQGTLNAYGYGEGTVLVAGYRHSDHEPAAYSASGAEDMPRRSKGPDRKPLVGPDIAAVSDASPSLPGILGTGTYSGSVARMNGTSVAAPQAVRQLADKIAAGGSVESLIGAIPEPTRPFVGKPESEDDLTLRLGAGPLPFISSRRGQN
jgi:hypothetical protein